MQLPRAAEESGFESELDSHARASRRGIRSIWRSGVGLHGAFEGRFALLQCLQLVLRLQLQKLREVWGDKLPRETEAVARDLWAMFVSLLPVGHYPPEPLIAATFDWHTRTALSQQRAAELFPNHQTYDPQADIHAHRRTMLFNAFHHHCERSARGEDVAHAASPRSMSTTAPTPRIQAWPRSASIGSSAMPKINAPRQGRSARSRWRVWRIQRTNWHNSTRSLPNNAGSSGERRPRASHTTPRPSTADRTGRAGSGQAEDEAQAKAQIPAALGDQNAVGTAQTEILQLATVPDDAIHRVPRAASAQGAGVLGRPGQARCVVRAAVLNVVHRLPLPLTRSLNKDNVHHHMLDTDAVPSISALHLHTLGVAELLQRTYGVEFGDANVSGQLARMTEAMLLPPTFYVATKRLLDTVARGVTPQLLPLRTKGRQDAEEDGKKASLPGAALVQRLPKEFVLMAALLVTVKMRYGLDGQERSEGVGVDGAVSCAPELEAWLAALDARRDRFRASREAVKRVRSDRARSA